MDSEITESISPDDLSSEDLRILRIFSSKVGGKIGGRLCRTIPPFAKSTSAIKSLIKLRCIKECTEGCSGTLELTTVGYCVANAAVFAKEREVNTNFGTTYPLFISLFAFAVSVCALFKTSLVEITFVESLVISIICLSFIYPLICAIRIEIYKKIPYITKFWETALFIVCFAICYYIALAITLAHLPEIQSWMLSLSR